MMNNSIEQQEKQQHAGKIQRKARFSSTQNIESKKEPSKNTLSILRNELVLKYNELIRKGDPATKKLRRQIHEQISEIESGS
jgi:hypothetical protein